MECPNCHSDIGAAFQASLENEHRMSFKITPSPGQRVCAKTVGGSLRSFGRLLEAIGRDLGTHTTALVDRIETTEDGEIIAHLVIARVIPLAEMEQWLIAEVRSAGCECDKPLLGYRPGVGPRCRLCNVVAGAPAAPGERER